MSWPEDNPVLVRKADAGCKIAAWHLHRLRCLKRNIDPAGPSARFELDFIRAVEEVRQLSYGVVKFPAGIEIRLERYNGTTFPETVPL